MAESGIALFSIPREWAQATKRIKQGKILCYLDAQVAITLTII